MGVQDAENKAHGANDFRTTDGKPEWSDVALFLQRNKARLDAKHHEFVEVRKSFAPCCLFSASCTPIA
jgi:hypothetical protein